MMQLDDSARRLWRFVTAARLAHAQIRQSQFIKRGNTSFSKGKNEEVTPDDRVFAAQKQGS
jgi:hypothetical protein